MRGREIEKYGTEREDESQSTMSVGRGGGSSGASGEKRVRDAIPARGSDKEFHNAQREVILDRGREYSLRTTEMRSLYQAGRFRVVSETDLSQGVYGGQGNVMHQDLRSLQRQGLIRRFRVVSRKAGEKLRLLVLTKEGKRIAERIRPEGARDRVYQGFVKPAEAVHDAMLYRMFQHEEKRIHDEGGRVVGVRLDYELKGRVYADIAKTWKSRSPEDYVRHHAEAAAAHELPVIEGRIAFPDVRVEYEDAAGESRRVDLELATENYRSGHIGAKVKAGFRLYVPGALLSGRLKGGFYGDREISAGIFAL